MIEHYGMTHSPLNSAIFSMKHGKKIHLTKVDDIGPAWEFRWAYCGLLGMGSNEGFIVDGMEYCLTCERLKPDEVQS
tara:strand:- start:2764 stop:2994 length:231 start_codon:yes stop_codon:yes gene_type:complete